jgi:ACS family hexuronate transporter-like MFS transporter
VSPEEVRHIRSDTTATTTASVPWVRLLGFRQTWAYAVAKLLCDPVWFFYLFWLPKFLDTKYGVKLSGLALPLIVVYVVADIGSVAGGWLSSRLISRGWSINRARKTVMLVMACLIVPTAFAPLAPTMWVAILAVAVAAAAHQAWMANVFGAHARTSADSAVAARSDGEPAGRAGHLSRSLRLTHGLHCRNLVDRRASVGGVARRRSGSTSRFSGARRLGRVGA